VYYSRYEKYNSRNIEEESLRRQLHDNRQSVENNRRRIVVWVRHFWSWVERARETVWGQKKGSVLIVHRLRLPRGTTPFPRLLRLSTTFSSFFHPFSLTPPNFCTPLCAFADVREKKEKRKRECILRNMFRSIQSNFTNPAELI